MCNDVFTLLFFSFLTKICNNKITQCICDRRQTQWKCRLQSNGWNTQQHEIQLIFFSTEKGLVEFRVWWSLVVSADLNSVFVVHFIGESFTQFINRFDGRWNGFSKTRNRDFFFLLFLRIKLQNCLSFIVLLLVELVKLNLKIAQLRLRLLQDTILCCASFASVGWHLQHKMLCALTFLAHSLCTGFFACLFYF